MSVYSIDFVALSCREVSLSFRFDVTQFALFYSGKPLFQIIDALIFTQKCLFHNTILHFPPPPFFATSRIFVLIIFSPFTFTLTLQWRTCKLKVVTNQCSNIRLHFNGHKKNLPPPSASMVNLQETICCLTSYHVVQLKGGASVYAQECACTRMHKKYCVLAGLLTHILNVYKTYKEIKHCGYSKSKRDTVR